MAKKKKERIDLSDSGSLSQSPFASLGVQFGVKPGAEEKPQEQKQTKSMPQPMLLVRKEKRAKGKVVTRIFHLANDHKAMLKKLKARLGTGGSIEDDVLELQGDCVEKVADVLQNEGFKVRKG